jgi:uncharacterized protein (TIGR03086 family)
MGPLEQLDEVGALLGRVVGNITPDQLDNQTPCEKFAVRDVLGHMIGGATMFAAAFTGTAPGAAPDGDPLADFGPTLGGLVAAVSAPGALDQTVEAPFGPTPGDTFARFIALDGLVHGWDMAVATGQSYEPSDALVAEVTAFATNALDPLRDGDTFANATTPPAGASPIAQLAALSGPRVPLEA